MGSDSDLTRLEGLLDHLRNLEIPFEARVLSAHRTPRQLIDYVEAGSKGEIGVFICAAGGAAHLAGVVAAHTLCPVIGVPLDNAPFGGLDALLATVQMPGGIPVACVASGGGGPVNAALFAARILALGDPELAKRLDAHREQMVETVLAKDKKVQAINS
jgi:5-(carboxyamino)imidazole ribonucleotide mutase